MTPWPGSDRQAQMARQLQLYPDTLHAVRVVTGVTAVALAARWPFERPGPERQLVRSTLAVDKPFEAEVQYVWGDYLGTLGARLVEGRTFGATDAAGTVVIVNEAMAAQLKKYGPVLGSSVALTRTGSFRVVGIFANVTASNVTEPVAPQMFWNSPGSVLLARITPTDIPRSHEGILAAVSGIWGARAPRTLVSIQRESRLARSDYLARQLLLAALAIAGIPVLLMSLVGTLGTVLQRRRRELAVRQSLGAGVRHIRALMLIEMLTPVTTGLVLGLLAGWLAGRLMRHYLFHVVPMDVLSVITSLTAVFVLTVCVIEVRVRRVHLSSPSRALNSD
jgi:hypothetical protein